MSAHQAALIPENFPSDWGKCSRCGACAAAFSVRLGRHSRQRNPHAFAMF